jgi:hypothetical protein
MLLLTLAQCGYPVNGIRNDSVPKVDDNDGLLVEGSTITFSCPPGLELIGPHSATCRENGEWEPDPSGLFCNDSSSITGKFEKPTL